MEKYPISIYADHPEPYFEQHAAALLARVSEVFIRQCERQGLITCRVMLHGKKGLCVEDISRLKVIRHLNEDMGLDLDAVDFIMRYRGQIETLQRRLEELEKQLHRKEQEHLTEIQTLQRRLTQMWDGG